MHSYQCNGNGNGNGNGNTNSNGNSNRIQVVIVIVILIVILLVILIPKSIEALLERDDGLGSLLDGLPYDAIGSLAQPLRYLS